MLPSGEPEAIRKRAKKRMGKVFMVADWGFRNRKIL
jgi:hypothetical protein